MNKKINLILMVGLPATGKTTIRKYINQKNKYTIVCPDEYIESQAKINRVSFHSQYQTSKEEIKKLVSDQLQYCSSRNKNVIVDMGNLTKMQRKDILKYFDLSKFKVVAIHCTDHIDNIKTRNEIRKQNRRDNPDLLELNKITQTPSTSEGFDVVLTVHSGTMEDSEQEQLNWLR